MHSVRVLCLRGKDEPPAEEALAERCEKIEEIPRPSGKSDILRAARLLRAWVAGRPMWVEDWSVPAFRERIRETVAGWQPDVVQFEYHIMVQYLDAIDGSASVLVQYEPGAAAAKDRWVRASGWRRAVLRRDMEAWERYERGISALDAVVCLTKHDQSLLTEVAPGARFFVIPPAGPPVPAASSIATGTSGAVLFVGNYIHPPNEEAELRLGRKILP